MSDRSVDPIQPRNRRPALLALTALALASVLGAALLWLRKPEPVPAPAAPASLSAPLPAMAPLAMDQVPDLPEQHSGEDGSPIAELRRGRLPSTMDDLEALGWAEAIIAADNAAPPIPQRLSGDSLRRGQVARGAAVHVVGRMEECVPVRGHDDRRWLSLVLEDRHYCLVLAPASAEALPLNALVQAVGRQLGTIPATTSAGAPQATPLIIARTVTSVDHVVGAPTTDPLREFHVSGFSPPPDIGAKVDDELPLLETRPYYYALGQAKSDLSLPGVFDDAIDANARANDIHADPASFRGRAMTVTGWVYDAWEDEQVAQDRPFEVTRVVRILLHKSDVGPITENGVTTTKAVLRLYEIAVIGDLPVPKPGERIMAWGRFLKWRAIPVPHDPGRDAELGLTRHSDNVYTLLIVATRFATLSPDVVDLRGAKVALAVVAGALCLFVMVFLLLDGRASARARAARAATPRRSGRNGTEKPDDTQAPG